MDDVVFIVDSERKLADIITKLERLQPFLNLNKSKCGVIATRAGDLGGTEFLGIPIVEHYKYLGCLVSPSTTSVLKHALALIDGKLH